MQEIESLKVEIEPRLVSNDRHGERSYLPRSKKILPASPSRRLAPLNSNCVVCGRENANGLQLNFVAESKGVHATWIPKETWESFRGTVHGGIITAVLDEAMSKAIVARGWEAFTVELKVRFHLRVCPGERLHVEGWVREKRKRRILAEASLAGPAGQERAHAWATFLVPPGERS